MIKVTKFIRYYVTTTCITTKPPESVTRVSYLAQQFDTVTKYARTIKEFLPLTATNNRLSDKVQEMWQILFTEHHLYC